MNWDDTNKALAALQQQFIVALRVPADKRTPEQERHLDDLRARARELGYIRIALLIEARKEGKLP